LTSLPLAGRASIAVALSFRAAARIAYCKRSWGAERLWPAARPLPCHAAGCYRRL